jgi:ParB-like chromosome segregation protein Spo0J
MSIEVHPSAAVFPMMTDDELADLAADIKENGLLHPIVRDADGVLIDGRNRLRACEIAGVEPSFTTLNGHDATALIVSANLNRRNLTKGQQAMALAMIYPEPAKGGRGKKALGTEGFSQARLSQARSVLRHSRSLAERVMARQLGLDEALDLVECERTETQNTDAKLAELHAEAPDLADLVEEERLGVHEAYATLVMRRREAEKAEANKRESLLRLSELAWSAVTAWASEEFVAELGDRYEDEVFAKLWQMRVRPDAARLDEILKGAQAMAQFFEQAVKEGRDV